MSNRILNMIDEIKRIEASAPVVSALTRPAPLARKLPTGASIFGKTSELQAVISEIRAIEAHNPSVTKFTAPVVVGNFCNKKDLLTAKNHLQQLKAAKPGATVRKSIAAITKPQPKAETGRTAAELLALSSADQQAICRRACNTKETALRAEIMTAFQSMPASAERSKFYQTFKTAIKH